MDRILSTLHQGPKSFLDYIEKAEELGPLEIGILLSLEQSQLKSELQFLKVLWKTSLAHKSMQGPLILKYLKVFQVVVSSVNKSNPFYLLTNFLEEIEKVGQIIQELEKNNEKLINVIRQQFDTCYKDLINLYSNSCEMVKFLRIGKEFPNFLYDFDQSVLTKEDVANLIKIIDSDQIVAGCIVLNKICLELQKKKNEILNKLVVSFLIFLMETKAGISHAKPVVQYLNCFKDVFNKVTKDKLIKAYKVFCDRLSISENFELLNMGIEASDKKVDEPKNDWKKNTNNEKNIPQNPEKKAEEKKNYKRKENNKETFEKNEKYKKKTKNPVQQPTSLEPFPNKTANIQAKEIQEKNQSNDRQLIKIPKNSYNKKIEDLDLEIECIIEETKQLFENKTEFQTSEIYEKFMNLDIKGYENRIFFKVDQKMAEGKPNEVKARFWKIILKVLNKLTFVTEYELQGLYSKLKIMKGNVRDNKEKVSRKKETKEKFKEELKSQGKYQEGLQANDRENKRSLKKIITKPEKKPIFDYSTMSDYIYKLSQDSLNLIRENSLDIRTREIINDCIKMIRNKLNLVSSKSDIIVIGSANIGTWLKNSEIDVIITDKENPNEEVLIKAFPEAKKLSPKSFSIVLPNSFYKFKVFLENDFAIETSKLIKKYCMVDARINELIMFIKLKSKEESLDFVNGFHWTLLVLSFLQNLEPAVIGSLQENEHKEKIVNGKDVWFDSDYYQASPNCCSLGQLIYHFFHFYSENFAVVCDVKTGKVEVCENLNFIVLHPFTGIEIGRDFDENQKIQLHKWIKNEFFKLSESGSLKNPEITL